MKFTLSILFLLVAAVESFAEVQPNALFQSNAVLQRDTPIHVWGTTTTPNEKVTVTLGNQSATTMAVSGKWSVDLPALHASLTPLTMTIRGANTLTLDNILIGDVWVCSGQSNMEFTLLSHWPKPVPNREKMIAAANFPNIRLFQVKHAIATQPQENIVGKWDVCSPETVKSFSAVGYFFGRDLSAALPNVPIGLIQSTWGGTPAESWTRKEALDAIHFQNQKSGEKKLRQFPTTPSCLWNGMIAPLLPFPIRGVVWYQGESNSVNGTSFFYRTLFPAMIADWRKNWHCGDFPFLFVQLAPFKVNLPELRESQLLTLQKSPNTAMVVTTDVGDTSTIHPTQKEPVGSRLALAARALSYGEKIEFSGPLFSGATFANGKATVSFTHVGKGLIAKNGALTGFVVSGSDGVFVPANAEIAGDKVIVSSPQISAPTNVRYGWEAVPVVNLFNADGLPASPFRSDVNAAK